MSKPLYGKPYTGHDYDGPVDPPSLPYAGTSGYSGTEASKQRVEKNDTSGKTGRVQRAVVNAVAGTWERGLTIKELRELLPDDHHGTLSSALTCCWMDGRIMRLADETRDRCSVYVAPNMVNDRNVVEPTKPPKREVVEIPPYAAGYQDIVEIVGRATYEALRGDADEVIVRWRK